MKANLLKILWVISYVVAVAFLVVTLLVMYVGVPILAGQLLLGTTVVGESWVKVVAFFLIIGWLINLTKVYKTLGR